MPAREDAPRRRRVLPWILGGVVLAGLCIAWLMAPAGNGDAPRPHVAAPAPSRPAPPPSPAPGAPGTDSELPEAIRRYLASTPYPGNNGLLTENHLDLLEPNRRHETPRPIPDTLNEDLSQVVSSIFTADRYFYTSDDEVHAFLKVTRGRSALNVRLLGASLVREARAGAVGQALPLDFRWERDRYAADFPLDLVADHHGPVMLSIRFEYAPGEPYEETLRLFVTPADRIPARFTGEFEDGVTEGSLEIRVGLEVDTPGFYRFDANLYDQADRPVAFALFKGELGAGSKTVPLSFYGKLFRDASAPGPWVLGELRGYRFIEGSFPDRERLRDLPERYTTSDHPLQGFTDEDHTSDHERHMVELMLEDIARGISLEFPAAPVSP